MIPYGSQITNQTILASLFRNFNNGTDDYAVIPWEAMMQNRAPHTGDVLVAVKRNGIIRRLWECGMGPNAGAPYLRTKPQLDAMGGTWDSTGTFFTTSQLYYAGNSDSAYVTYMEYMPAVYRETSHSFMDDLLPTLGMIAFGGFAVAGAVAGEAAVGGLTAMNEVAMADMLGLATAEDIAAVGASVGVGSTAATSAITLAETTEIATGGASSGGAIGGSATNPSILETVQSGVVKAAGGVAVTQATNYANNLFGGSNNDPTEGENTLYVAGGTDTQPPLNFAISGAVILSILFAMSLVLLSRR